MSAFSNTNTHPIGAAASSVSDDDASDVLEMEDWLHEPVYFLRRADINSTKRAASPVTTEIVVDDDAQSMPSATEIVDDVASTVDTILQNPDMIAHFIDRISELPMSMFSAENNPRLAVSAEKFAKRIKVNTETVYTFWCSICYSSPTEICALICGHVFCQECATQMRNVSKKCALCNARITPKRGVLADRLFGLHKE